MGMIETPKFGWEILAIKSNDVWWLECTPIRPSDKLQCQMYHVKEHEPTNWFALEMETAQNVVKIEAWFDYDEKCQAYEIGYCEMRLTRQDFEDIESRLRAFADIPF